MKSLKLGLLKRGLKNVYEILEVQGVLALCIQISLVQISLLRFIKTITKICLMRFHVLFIFLLCSIAKNLANAIFGFPGPKSCIRQKPSVSGGP